MREIKSKPTIEDVARQSGVSISTVSRVINQSSPVSQEIELKVRKAIKELDFTPRRWKERTMSKTIAMVVPDILNSYYAEVINGAQEEADRQGMDIVILDVSENPERQKQRLMLLKKWMFDGLLVIGTRFQVEALFELHAQYNLPIVLARSAEIPQFPCILSDNRTGISQAIHYLLSLNHTRIAYISGPPEWDSAMIRLEAVQKTFSDLRLSFPSQLYRWCFPNVEEGAQTMSSLLSLPLAQRPTAVLTYNDVIAIGAMHAIHNIALRVPEDLSVIGHGDISIAAYMNPPLTTIAQPTYRIGQLAIKKIYDIIYQDMEVDGGVTTLECPLIVRKSTAICPE